MKYFLTFLCFFLILPLLSAQHNNEVGGNFFVSTYRPKGDLSYNNVENRFALGVGISYTKIFKDPEWAFQGEIIVSSRVSEITTDFSERGKISEGIIQLPLFLQLRSPKNEGKFGMSTGIGPQFNFLMAQETLFPEPVAVPESYDEKEGFAAFTRIGLAADIRFHLQVHEKSLFVWGLRSNIDLATFGKESDDNFTRAPEKLEVGVYLGVVRTW